MGSFDKNIQAVIEFLMVPFFSYYTLFTFLLAIYADDTTVYSRFEQASDLCHELEVTSELESDVHNTVDCGRKWLVVCTFSIGITLVDDHLNWLNWFHFLILMMVPLIILIGCMIFSVTIHGCFKDVYANSFFSCTPRLLDFLPAECFP